MRRLERLRGDVQAGAHVPEDVVDERHGVSVAERFVPADIRCGQPEVLRERSHRRPSRLSVERFSHHENNCVIKGIAAVRPRHDRTLGPAGQRNTQPVQPTTPGQITVFASPDSSC
jgi:hypothetical protein